MMMVMMIVNNDGDDTNTWTEMAPMWQSRINHSVACVETKVYVMGGNDRFERGNEL